MRKPLRVPSGRTRGSRKHESPSWRLREDEERVAHRRRAEPLVAGELVLAVADRLGARRVGADVGAALLLGHRHAAERAALPGRRAQAGVVLERREPRLPLGRELRAARAAPAPPRTSSRCGHVWPASTCAIEREERRAGDVRAGARLAPGERVQPVPDARRRAASARPGGTRPRRSGCRSGRACAAAAGSRSRAGPTRAARRPGARRTTLARSCAQPAPSRASASTSGRFSRKRL